MIRMSVRNGLFLCMIGILVGVFVLVAGAQEDGYPLALGRLGETQTGPYVQSGPAVVKILLRLAEEQEYTPAQATALADAVARLLGDEVPPGTILQVSKDLLETLSPDDMLAALDELGTRIMNDEPPGQVANELLGRGNAKKADPEDEGASNGHACGKADFDEDASDSGDPSENEDSGDEDEDVETGNGQGNGKPETKDKGKPEGNGKGKDK